MAEMVRTVSKTPSTAVAKALREFALSLPGAHEDFPWGERVAKVGKKVFVFLGHADADKAAASAKKSEHVGEPGGLSLSVKLPRSRLEALSLPFASPTGYGLGKAGWVSARFGRRDRPPLELLIAWIEESYRAVAPKKLVKELEARGT
jgi:predicted DNA-binding protein (MmcQ/YjbR family)